MCRTKVSVWDFKLSYTRASKVAISLGHYAITGFSKPSKAGYQSMLLTDMAMFGFFRSKSLDPRVVDALLPHPTKYQQVYKGVIWQVWKGMLCLFVCASSFVGLCVCMFDPFFGSFL